MPSSAPKPETRSRAALLQRHPWLTFLLPLAVYMLVGSIEPTRDADQKEHPGGTSIGLAIPYSQYPLVYAAKIVLTAIAIAFVWPGYRAFPLRTGEGIGGGLSQFSFDENGTVPLGTATVVSSPVLSVTPLAILVGIVGVVLWIGLCRLNLEQEYLMPVLRPIRLDWLIAAGARSAFNPLEELAGRPAWAWGFLAVRFLGLVAIVPLCEEFFYRGLLIRFVVQHDWWNVPPGKVTAAAAVLATLVPMAMHPAELLAAAVWFSLITWMYVKTRSVWDCVAAHAVTNLLLGIYVVYTGEWQLM